MLQVKYLNSLIILIQTYITKNTVVTITTDSLNAVHIDVLVLNARKI